MNRKRKTRKKTRAKATLENSGSKCIPPQRFSRDKKDYNQNYTNKKTHKKIKG